MIKIEKSWQCPFKFKTYWMNSECRLVFKPVWRHNWLNVVLNRLKKSFFFLLFISNNVKSKKKVFKIGPFFRNYKHSIYILCYQNKLLDLSMALHISLKMRVYNSNYFSFLVYKSFHLIQEIIVINLFISRISITWMLLIYAHYIY